MWLIEIGRHHLPDEISSIVGLVIGNDEKDCGPSVPHTTKEIRPVPPSALNCRVYSVSFPGYLSSCLFGAST
jgi:hypothetical protein